MEKSSEQKWADRLQWLGKVMSLASLSLIVEPRQPKPAQPEIVSPPPMRGRGMSKRLFQMPVMTMPGRA